MAWIPLIEYSTKFGISMSTLRRRIRARAITYKIEDGKYLLLEEEHGRDLEISDPQFQPPQALKSPRFGNAVPSGSAEPSQQFFKDAQKMLEEIKKAYTLILQEKEEQICELKDEISDLRTLVRVLETENSRKKIR